MSGLLERIAAWCIRASIRLRLRGIAPEEQGFSVEVTQVVHRVIDLIVGVDAEA